MEKSIKVKLKCIFCGYDKFELPYEGYQSKEREQITCPNCGKSNDFSSLKQIAIKEGVIKIKQDTIKDIKKILKNFK